jgi:hypothetical protein
VKCESCNRAHAFLKARISAVLFSPGGEDLAAYLAGRERSDAEARWAELVPPYQGPAASIRSLARGGRLPWPGDTPRDHC